MQAIRTTKLAPTNTRGARMKATAVAGSITVGYDQQLNWDDNHRMAAAAFIAKMGWDEPGYGQLVSGCLSDGSYCHVMTGRDGKGS